MSAITTTHGSTPTADLAAVIRRLMLGLGNHAAWLVEYGYATVVELDTAMRLGAGMREGPLRTLDSFGLDTVYTELRALYAATGQWRHNPAPVLRELATVGRLGLTTGRGFHDYADGDSSGGTAGGKVPGAAPRNVRSVGVVGTGTMARGIAQVLVAAHYPVRILGRGMDKAEAATRSIGDLLLATGLDDAQLTDCLARLHPTGRPADLGGCDLVIEAVIEDGAVKRELFARLGVICRPGAVLATTTSSLPVLDCAIASGRPADVVGMHFFNPVASMGLVELVDTGFTGEDSMATAVAVADRLGKWVLRCRDRAGFIVNLLLFPYLNEALGLPAANDLNLAEVDASIRATTCLPLGPFRLLDMIGADVALEVLRNLHTEFGQPEFAPTALLVGLVESGCLGRKTNRGVRHYLADQR
ncbi:3-hydroxyacyl-CoA dehydrogenase family protein [Pseudonocardia spinosispora]|uniref:3-hydroxyacyl-CoA dehydrogenase family protein n=1 Tax=Pseudonocardia spinosispora TaxID=103441 RepID=UPI00042A4821|nr:3-hydroxyacyl-CoA dehydrogenase family protein [Pseudonocardia spinosispora]